MWHCLREGVLEASSEQNWDRANHRFQPKGVWGRNLSRQRARPTSLDTTHHSLAPILNRKLVTAAIFIVLLQRSHLTSPSHTRRLSELGL